MYAITVTVLFRFYIKPRIQDRTKFMSKKYEIYKIIIFQRNNNPQQIIIIVLFKILLNIGMWIFK